MWQKPPIAVLQVTLSMLRMPVSPLANGMKDEMDPVPRELFDALTMPPIVVSEMIPNVVDRLETPLLFVYVTVTVPFPVIGAETTK
jgi:hypothetical protein